MAGISVQMRKTDYNLCMLELIGRTARNPPRQNNILLLRLFDFSRNFCCSEEVFVKYKVLFNYKNRQREHCK